MNEEWTLPPLDSPDLAHISKDLRPLAVPIDSILPDPQNVMTHPERNFNATRASLSAYGQRKSIVVNERTGIVEAGNGTLEAGKSLGWKWIARSREDDDHVTAAGYAVADNRTAQLAEWDEPALALQLEALGEDGVELELLGFTAEELEHLKGEEAGGGSGGGGEDPGAEPPPPDPVSVLGEVYHLGPHRIMCGDSTSRKDVKKLVGETKAPMLHADPPYGMGKESEGVENDNLYDEKLDAFQMKWWKAWRPCLEDNGSVYIWGNPEPLWRLWFLHLKGSEEISLRNEIVWDKGSGFGQRSELLRCYSVNTERCLFFMLGRQFFGNVNKDDFFEGFQPILDWLIAEVKKAGWGPKDIKRICGVSMYGHWFSQSQWTLVPENRYAQLQAAAEGKAFTLPYAELKEMKIAATEGGDHLSAARSFNEMRAYFDNAHDNMNEVWTFPRVSGEERFGHATPKPVDVCERMVRSSCPDAGLVLEPFGGSGSTLIAAAKAGRVCYSMEITPGYVDVIRKRWGAYARSAGIDPGPGAL